MIYINNCKLLIINRCKDIKKYQLLNYSPLLVPPTTPIPARAARTPFPASPPSGVRGYSHNSHSSHPIPARAARTPSLPVRLAPPPSLSEFFIKKYFSHFQLTTKNFQKKLRKNLQDKKNAVPLHPQMRQNMVSKQETTRTLT